MNRFSHRPAAMGRYSRAMGQFLRAACLCPILLWLAGCGGADDAGNSPPDSPEPATESPEPTTEATIDESGTNVKETVGGKIGWVRVDEESVGLNDVIAYNAESFTGPIIVLLLTAEPVSEEKQRELEEMLKQKGSDTGFYADGPSVRLKLWPSGDLQSMNAWIGDRSLGGNPWGAMDVQVDGDKISGTIAISPAMLGDIEFELQAELDTNIKF